MARKKISRRSPRGDLQKNPAERAGPDIGVLELRYQELAGTSPWETVTLVYLPEFERLVRAAADSGDPADTIAHGLMARSLYVLLGSISMAPAEKGFTAQEKRCGPVLIVRGSWAQPDYGPLLYDAALALADRQDRGLMSDRVSVSDRAQGVWRFYRDKRPEVESSPAPRGCPAHGVDELDRVYWAKGGFAKADFERMRKQMQTALKAASRATGLPGSQVAHLILDAASMAHGLAVFDPPLKVVRRARAANPAPVWFEGRRPMSQRELRVLKRRLMP